MIAYQWLVNDGYQYMLACTKEDAFQIISKFGPKAKAPTYRVESGIKYSFYVINTQDKIITPYGNPIAIAGPHAGDWSDPLFGEPVTLAIFLDDYRLKEYPDPWWEKRKMTP